MPQGKRWPIVTAGKSENKQRQSGVCEDFIIKIKLQGRVNFLGLVNIRLGSWKLREVMTVVTFIPWKRNAFCLHYWRSTHAENDKNEVVLNAWYARVRILRMNNLVEVYHHTRNGGRLKFNGDGCILCKIVNPCVLKSKVRYAESMI